MKTSLLLIIAMTQLFYGYSSSLITSSFDQNPFPQTKIDTPLSHYLGQIGLKGQLQDGVVSLKWATISQKNIEGFRIQRYTTSGYWHSIGYVEANKNIVSEIKKYSFVDSNPIPGLSHYRLMYSEFEGEIEYSNTITIQMEESKEIEIQLFPNPSDGKFTLQLKNLNGQSLIIYIFDPNGKLVWKHSNNVVYDWQKQLFFSLNGYYSIYIQTGNAMYMKKLLIK